MNEQLWTDGTPSRRRFLTLLGVSVGAAGATIGVPTMAAAARSTTEETTRKTSPRLLASSGDSREEVRPSFAIDHVAVAGVDAADVTIESERNGQWVALAGLANDCTGKTLDDGAAVAVRRLPGDEACRIAGPAGRVVTINTTDGPPVTHHERPGGLTAPVPGIDDLLRSPVEYLSRQAWGGDDVEALRFDEDGNDRWGSPPSYYPVQKLTVHHTATDNDDPDPAATVRAIYRFHTIDRNFGDIGYQLLIDEAGAVYEGRYSGEDPIPGHSVVRVDGDRRSGTQLALHGVQGAHVGGFNSGNFGVALLGNLVDRQPTEAAYRSLVGVLALLCAVNDLKPSGDEPYVNPVNGVEAAVPNIVGHSQWVASECPGSLLDLLPTIRSDVDRLMEMPAKGYPGEMTSRGSG